MSSERLERRLYAALLATNQLAVFRATAENDMAPFVDLVVPRLRPPLPSSIPVLLEGLRALHRRLQRSPMLDGMGLPLPLQSQPSFPIRDNSV
jgi:hypothetical protein